MIPNICDKHHSLFGVDAFTVPAISVVFSALHFLPEPPINTVSLL